MQIDRTAMSPMLLRDAESTRSRVVEPIEVGKEMAYARDIKDPPKPVAGADEWLAIREAETRRLLQESRDRSASMDFFSEVQKPTIERSFIDALAQYAAINRTGSR